MQNLIIIRIFFKKKIFYHVARQLLGNIVMPDVAKNLQGPEMYLCANFGRSSPDGLRGDQGQRHRHRDILCIIKEICSEDIKEEKDADLPQLYSLILAHFTALG